MNKDDVSVRLDGRGILKLSSSQLYLISKASIEHQIDIHVQDLSTISSGDFSLLEILQGLKYVMDYRIKGGKMKNLELSLMKKLLEGLLQNMQGREGNLLNQRPTQDADLAFTIFGDFLEEVVEFRQAVSEASASDLRHALKIHRRCHPRYLD